MRKLLIHNARLLDPAVCLDEMGDLLLSGGRIEEVGEKLTCLDAVVINGEGLIAAPGLVDMHVHLRDPGFTEKEDILTGCDAAASGGVTSLLCMPNTSPAVDTEGTVRYIIEKAVSASAHVYPAGAITAGLKGQVLTDFSALKKAGIIAVSDDGRPVADSALMARAMCIASQLGLRVVSHCEDLFFLKGGLMNEGKISANLKIKGVPAAAEDCGTAREIALAEAYGVPVHICHVSTHTSVGMIRDAKHRGVKVTAETAPHYFSLTEQELLSRDADYRMSPPLRTVQDRLAVMEGLRDGTIDVIATDHAPHTPQEKSNFETAPNGSIGMETSLAAGITWLVETGCLTLSELIDKMSTAPAHLLGLDAGTLMPGAPADVVLFDPAECWTVNTDNLHGKSKNAVFKGKALTGRVKMTICGGKIVYNDWNKPV